ncbi:MAG: hypothetical protein KKF50_03445 [Nanoarchaeota archaeon]|nr:hypothetical protein [Nanoarchaeota archaeon]
MESAIWVMVSILILIVILGVLAVMMAIDKKGKGPDYYIMFLIGLVWVPIGIIMQMRGDSSAFWVIGLIFLIVGFGHKKDWKKNRKPFSKLKKKQKRFAWIVILLLALIILIGIASIYIRNNGVI